MGHVTKPSYNQLKDEHLINYKCVKINYKKKNHYASKITDKAKSHYFSIKYKR